MKKLVFLISLAPLCFLTFCNPKGKEEKSIQAKIAEEQGTKSRKLLGSDSLPILPKLTRLNNIKQTEFSLTLENSISENKNIIYCPTFLYAWDGVKQKLKHQIQQNNRNSQDFKLLNQSTSFLNALSKEDYSSEVKTGERAITIKTSFFQGLAF